AQCTPDVVRPDVGGKPVMGVIGHADDFLFVAPADGNQYGAEDFLAGQAPVVGGVGKERRNCKIPLREWAILWRQAAKHQLTVGLTHPLIDVIAHLLKLFVIDERTDIGLLIERIADFELGGLLAQPGEKILEYTSVQK